MYIQGYYILKNEFGFILLIDMSDSVLFIYYQNKIKEGMALKFKFKFSVNTTSSLCYYKRDLEIT